MDNNRGSATIPKNKLTGVHHDSMHHKMARVSGEDAHNYIVTGLTGSQSTMSVWQHPNNLAGN